VKIGVTFLLRAVDGGYVDSNRLELKYLMITKNKRPDRGFVCYSSASFILTG